MEPRQIVSRHAGIVFVTRACAVAIEGDHFHAIGMSRDDKLEWMMPPAVGLSFVMKAQSAFLRSGIIPDLRNRLPFLKAREH